MRRGRVPVSWRAAAWLVGRLPWHSLAVFGALLGLVAGSLLRIRRAHVQSAMRAAGIARPVRESRAMYRALGRSAMEFLWFADRGREAFRHVAVDEPSKAKLDDAIASGRGVVLAASHTGNWDLAACAMAQEVELLVVTKRLRAMGLDAFWQATRQRQGVVLAQARGALAPSLRLLARGGAVAMMMDQVPDTARRAVDISFLGRPAAGDRAAAVLAARAGSPLVVAAGRRDRHGEHVLHVLDVIVPPDRPDRAWIDTATIRAAQALERFVRAYPSQWLWLHRRWKAPPSGSMAEVDRREGRATLAASCVPPSKTTTNTTRSSSPVAVSKAV